MLLCQRLYFISCLLLSVFLPTALFYFTFASEYSISPVALYKFLLMPYFINRLLLYFSSLQWFNLLTVSSVFIYQRLSSTLVCLSIFSCQRYITHLLLTTPFQMTENLLSCLPFSLFLPIVSFLPCVFMLPYFSLNGFMPNMLFTKHYSTASCYFSFSSQYIQTNSFVLFDIYLSVFSANEFAFLYFPTNTTPFLSNVWFTIFSQQRLYFISNTLLTVFS